MIKISFSGKQKFKIIWFGQSISLLGTAMTRFALLIWIYEETGNATSLAMLGFFSILPFVLFSPVAGSIIDRFDRKKIMMLADLGAGLMTVSITMLISKDNYTRASGMRSFSSSLSKVAVPMIAAFLS